VLEPDGRGLNDNTLFGFAERTTWLAAHMLLARKRKSIAEPDAACRTVLSI
jgi:hypothetical protein